MLKQNTAAKQVAQESSCDNTENVVQFSDAELAKAKRVGLELAKHPWPWRRAVYESDLRKNARFVILTLQERYVNADHGGLAWPSQATLAKLTDLSVRTVNDALRAAEAAGFLVRLGKPRRGSQRYVLSMPKGHIQTRQTLPDKNSDTAEGTSNTADVAIKNGNNCNQIRQGLPTNLLTESPKESLTESLKGEDELILDMIPGLDPTALPEPEGGWPEGLVKRCYKDTPEEIKHLTDVYISRAAFDFLGYDRGRSVLRAPNGEYLDVWVLSYIPADTLDAMATKCCRGTLTKREVAMACVACGIPHNQAEMAQ